MIAMRPRYPGDPDGRDAPSATPRRLLADENRRRSRSSWWTPDSWEA